MSRSGVQNRPSPHAAIYGWTKTCRLAYKTPQSETNPFKQEPNLRYSQTYRSFFSGSIRETNVLYFEIIKGHTKRIIYKDGEF
jgi:hypothetical protein